MYQISNDNKIHTLGTLIEPQYNYEGLVLPTSIIQRENIEIENPRQTIRGFPANYFLSTGEEYSRSREMPDKSQLQFQKYVGIPKSSYFDFSDTSTFPTDYQFTTRPMANLDESFYKIKYKYGTSSWVNQHPSRSEYRTNLGHEIMRKNNLLRSVRLY